MSNKPEVAIQQIFTRSWGVFKEDMVLYIIASLIVAVVGGLSLGILMPTLMVGFVKLVRKRMAGEEASAGDVFDFSAFVPALIVGIIIGVGVMVGSMLLVLPGIAVALVTGYSFHFIAYDDAGVGDALKGSFELVKDNIVLVLILMLILGVLNGIGSAVVLGALLTGPFSMVASTIAFEEMRGLKS